MTAAKLHSLVCRLVEPDPLVASEIAGDLSCFFCGEHFVTRETGTHKSDCPYVEAKQIENQFLPHSVDAMEQMAIRMGITPSSELLTEARRICDETATESDFKAEAGRFQGRSVFQVSAPPLAGSFDVDAIVAELPKPGANMIVNGRDCVVSEIEELKPWRTNRDGSRTTHIVHVVSRIS